MDYSYVILGSNTAANLQLQHFMDEHKDFVCAHVTESSTEGLNSILKYNPEVLFLDLRQNTMDLFQMVTKMYQYISNTPQIIGISNTKEYAYQALKSGFSDYWLAPYNEFDIRKSILKLRKKLPETKKEETICLQSYRDFRYIDTKEILYLKADNNATDFFLKDGSKVSAYKTLKTFELKLPDNFIRVHQSYILNSSYVSRINYGKNICALKKTNLILPFSKSYIKNIDVLKQKMTKIAIQTQN